MPAEEERAQNWEERKQQSNWAQSRPTHGSEMSPNRTHNNTQGNQEVQARQQPPNAAHAEPAISKHPPSLYKVPTNSTRVGPVPRAPGGARHGGGNRAVTSQPRTGQSTSYGDVKSSYGGGGRQVGQEWVRERGTQERQKTGGGATQAHRTREPHHERQGRAQQTRRGAQQGRRGNQNSGNREPEWRGWESVRMGGRDNKGDGLASQPRRHRVQGNPCSTGIRWGLSPAAQMGCLRNRSGSVEEQGTWASRTQKRSEAGYGRPVDRGGACHYLVHKILVSSPPPPLSSNTAVCR